MKFIKYIMILAFAVSIASCEMTELDLLQDPNNVTPENASLDQLYNNIQNEFEEVYSSSYYEPGAMARMFHQGSSLYLTSISPATLNGLWFNAYSDLFPDIDALLDIAEPNGLDIHAGSAKIMKAYTMMILVDLLGNVPYSQAGQGTDVISPVADQGSDVYAAAIALLDEAIAQLEGTNAASPVADLLCGGDADRWIKAANSIKLRAALNTRLVNADASRSTINSLISGGNLISAGSEDFVFQFGTERNNPNSRHPFYNNHYEIGDGDYMSNYYMWLLIDDKENANGNDVRDPRLRFYFTRKVDDAAGQDLTTYGCNFSVSPDQDAKPPHWNTVDPDLNYCYASADGYIGRDHLNPQGIPPDGPIRTSYGLYPGGGEFDFDQFEDTRQRGTTGGLGAGIWPIITASFVDFMRAEAALTLGTNDDARALLESGIRKSIAKVFSFASLVPGTMSTQLTLRDGSSGTVEDLYVPSQDDVDEYVDLVLSMYDAADNDGKLDVIIKEYYIAAWGNGVEAYNMWRRTGKPANMQPGLEAEVGDFPRSFFYPDVYVQRNANASQKGLTETVFWDNGSTDLY